MRQVFRIWNDYAGCWDAPPTEEQCQRMRSNGSCPYSTCRKYPCWEVDDDEKGGIFSEIADDLETRMCPLTGESCRLSECMWFLSERICAIAKIAINLDILREGVPVISIFKDECRGDEDV